MGVTLDNDKLISNVVSQSNIRKLQYNVLSDICTALANCYGPDASNTLILIAGGEGAVASQKPISKYTKDGRHILEKIVYTDMLANAIAGQIESITGKVDGEVGDGTTSATLLSFILYNKLKNVSIFKEMPAKIFMKSFKTAINNIKEYMANYKSDTNLEDIKNIAYTSTNGDDKITNDIYDIYKEFGLDVWINVGFSGTTETVIKAYDGLTLEVGYSDAAYVNTTEGSVNMRNPRIYQFNDPIDNAEMVAFLNKIISNNIYEPAKNRKAAIPTLIIAPKISRDADPVIRSLVDYLYRYNQGGFIEEKPPIAIVTNIGPNMATYLDIAQLCGCKKIIKYIDPKTQAQDVENNLAPTLDTIADWYGGADMVTIDESKTVFVNPSDMFLKDEKGLLIYDENNEPEKTQTFSNLLSFLTAELENAEKVRDDINVIAELRRRIHALNCTLVEYYIGGVSTEDMTAVKDAVEDAVKNCRSAAKHGVTCAANCAGLLAAHDYDKTFTFSVKRDEKGEWRFARAILEAYKDLVSMIYKNSYNEEKIREIISNIFIKKCPLNLFTEEYDNKVLCSAKTDEVILDTVSEILSYMFTANQALLPVASAKYTDVIGAEL